MTMEPLVCPRCGYAVAGDPPVCTITSCALHQRENWHPEEVPVRLIDY